MILFRTSFASGKAEKMLEGNRCELCKCKIETERAQHQQTKYHDHCAREVKNHNSVSSWSPEQRKLYMRQYMRRYRRDRKARLSAGSSHNATATSKFVVVAPLIVSSLLWHFVHHLSFESVLNFIRHLQMFVLEATAFGVGARVAWEHLCRLWKK